MTLNHMLTDQRLTHFSVNYKQHYIIVLVVVAVLKVCYSGLLMY